MISPMGATQSFFSPLDLDCYLSQVPLFPPSLNHELPLFFHPGISGFFSPFSDVHAKRVSLVFKFFSFYFFKANLPLIVLRGLIFPVHGLKFLPYPGTFFPPPNPWAPTPPFPFFSILHPPMGNRFLHSPLICFFSFPLINDVGLWFLRSGPDILVPSDPCYPFRTLEAPIPLFSLQEVPPHLVCNPNENPPG